MGYVDSVTHDCKRHRTSTLFATLYPATCKRVIVIRSLSFLQQIDKAVPAESGIRCVVMNCATHIRDYPKAGKIVGRGDALFDLATFFAHHIREK